MAFDQSTRNRLARFVKDVRDLITDEFTQKFAERFGISDDGTCAPLEKLTHLDEPGLATAALLRQRIDYLVNSHPEERAGRAAAVKRLAREQAFTVLNRLSALRMAEKRGLILESVGKGYQSKGYKLYATVAGTGLGETYERYRRYLFCLFDELAVDLGVLFDRHSPHGILFPREPALLGLLNLLNAEDLDHLWAEDETIGWIYQYYNDEAERKKMREQSAAPRNSRELAVRNQFFTPRYVVEFLTDNTLGRIWYEMTKGKTALRERCRYLVRRPNEVFLGNPAVIDHLDAAAPWVRDVILTADFSRLPEDPTLDELSDLGLAIDGYGEIERRSQTWEDFLTTSYTTQVEAAETGEHTWTGDAFVLWCALFAYQRNVLRNGEHARTALASGNPVLRSLWPALRQALTTPMEDASQEALIRQPVFIPHRPLKDPRELRLLDPACGSMHFGLYAFDLFAVIYAEAYATHVDYGNGGLRSGSGVTALSSVATDPDAFAREVPRLIVEHNIHGVDIDPRAAQIAALSLWLRAQKSWSQQGLAAVARPRITRSHIVCAEPMPGDKALLADFVANAFPAAERPVFHHLLERIFNHMQLAGEAGSLLKIEEEIRTAIEEAKALWEKSRAVSRELFSIEVINTTLRPGTQQELDGLESAVSQLGAKADFWESAEERIYQALRGYSEQAETTGSVQRRLFANDAAQGFAFIDLCRKRYDVAVMNPPFGDPSKLSRKTLEAAYEYLSNDMSVCFVQRMAGLLESCGRVGILSPRNPLFLESFVGYRRHFLLDVLNVHFLADLGFGVLDNAMIEVAAAVLQKPDVESRAPKMTMFRLLGAVQRENELLRGANSLFGELVYHVEEAALKCIESAPFCYWLTPSLLTKLAQTRLLKEVADAKWGLFTADDPRFLRTWWEVIPTKDWPAYFKGGLFSRFIYVPDLVIDWRSDGKTIKENRDHLGRSRSRLPNPEFYFKKGLSFPNVTFKGLAMRALPEASVFSLKGPGIFPHDARLTGSLLALLNSKVAELFVSAQSPTRRWDLAQISRIPIPQISESDALKLESRALECSQAELPLWCASETSRYFRPAAWNAMQWPSLRAGFEAFAEQMENAREKSEKSLSEVETIAQEIYELDERDRACVAKFTGDVHQQNNADTEGDESDEEDSVESASLTDFCKARVSFSFGITFGRWDIRYATGEQAAPELPDPFAALPVCSPGHLQNAQGLPAASEDVPASYPIRIPWGGILVDDPEHPLDLVSSVQAALSVILKDRAEAIEHEACELLGVATLRDWFRKPSGFFADHLKRYSKSRRQAPIYWPLSTKSGSYTLWIYYHRLSDQTLHTAIADFVEPKIKAVEATLASARANNRTREVADNQEFLDELRDFKAELERLTKLPWKPNLNDGVLITASPLWKLFRLPKWQKDLKACWEELEAGDYDWAHLARTIWPKRVEEKCKTDRSIAIAHDLGHLCQIELPKSKAKRGRKAKAVVEDDEIL